MGAKKIEAVGRSPSVWVIPSQLNSKVSSLDGVGKECPVILIESAKDLAGIPQHKKKLILTLASMRRFAEELKAAGRLVDYYALDDPDSQRRKAAMGRYSDCLRLHIRDYAPGSIRIARPSEYDCARTVERSAKAVGVPLQIVENNLFLTTPEEFETWASRQTELVMEKFYRGIRKRLGILMEEGYPIGGRWNYDAENRVPPMENMEFSSPPWPAADPVANTVIELVESRFPDHPGESEGFHLPVTREGYLKWLDGFLESRLNLFGMYQDAMVRESPLMYHSLLAPALNLGLIHPLEVVRKVEQAYHEGLAPINSAEGFIRQIIGWREYVRGVYWSRMPHYVEENFFGHESMLPKMYYTGNTRMACLREVLSQCQRIGYSHHIQRLMVLGNFALLTETKPKEVVKWFRSMHVDSCDWAVVPNVIGMILYADGGYLGTKPYAASAGYLGKMGNYCKRCYYRSRKRVGERACPFNFLYWYFLKKNEERLIENKRMTMVYGLLHRKSEGEIRLVVRSAEEFLDRVHTRGDDRRPTQKGSSSALGFGL